MIQYRIKRYSSFEPLMSDSYPDMSDLPRDWRSLVKQYPKLETISIFWEKEPEIDGCRKIISGILGSDYSQMLRSSFNDSQDWWIKTKEAREICKSNEIIHVLGGIYGDDLFFHTGGGTFFRLNLGNPDNPDRLKSMSGIIRTETKDYKRNFTTEIYRKIDNTGFELRNKGEISEQSYQTLKEIIKQLKQIIG